MKIPNTALYPPKYAISCVKSCGTLGVPFQVYTKFTPFEEKLDVVFKFLANKKKRGVGINNDTYAPQFDSGFKEAVVLLILCVHTLDVGDCYNRPVVLIARVSFTVPLILVDVCEHINEVLMCVVLPSHQLRIEVEDISATGICIALIVHSDVFVQPLLRLILL